MTVATAAPPSPPPSAGPALLTAEQYMNLPDDGRHTELVRGVIVDMSRPHPRHGYFCANIVRIVSLFAIDHDLGRTVSNDSAVITERDPDTVRGPDVAFYSFDRLPRGPMPTGPWPAPDLAFEVMSPNDRWADVQAKVQEYLGVGVRAVAVLDPAARTVTVFRPDAGPQVFAADAELTIPDVLPGFAAPVAAFLG